MRRSLLVVAVISGLILIGFMFSQGSKLPAQAQKALPSSGNASDYSKQLPVKKVVLFTSGVGYFQREGEVDGQATIDLSFPVTDIDDLLKSLMLQDLGGGQISAVGYDSFDPLERTLKSFALDLTQNPSFAQLIQQARGENVEIDWQGQTLKGSVVGVERQRQPAGKDQVVDVDYLNVLTAEGIRSLPLSQVQRVRFLNMALDNELRRALEVLAFSHDTHKRMVRLSFSGQGKRQVRVGYVIENPIWKTSYRLALSDNDRPFLQGWAIVDNASDEDWQNVQVSLVSGRPISFKMHLYEPLYVPRPLVELELFSGLRPPTHGGALEEAARKMAGEAFRREARDLGKADAAPAPAAAARPLDLQQGVAAVAAAQELGDFFQYVIKQPVNLPRQKSALLPIVNQNVDGSRFSIYNASVHAKHPLLGFKLKNSTDLHLMQGPITVLDNGSYAGDARILDLHPGEERLISHAVDLGMEVEPVAKSAPDQLVTVKIVKGIMQATYKLQQTKTYNAKNRSTHERQLLIEHPVRADWTLVGAEKPAERSREFYRFQVAVPAGKSASQEVVEEQGRMSQVILTTADDQTIRLYASSNVTSPKIKTALEQAIALKVKLAETGREIAQLDKEIRVIVDDQVRLRANMERVPENSPPYQRYLKKLDEQETQIERLQEQVRTVRQREDSQRKEYEAFLLNLNLE